MDLWTIYWIGAAATTPFYVWRCWRNRDEFRRRALPNTRLSSTVLGASISLIFSIVFWPLLFPFAILGFKSPLKMPPRRRP